MRRERAHPALLERENILKDSAGDNVECKGIGKGAKSRCEACERPSACPI